LPPNPIVTLSEEIVEISREVKDFIPMQQGDLNLPTPDYIIDAAAQAMKEGYTKYAPGSGYPELKNAIAEKLRRYNRIDCKMEKEILVTQGSNEALYVSLHTLLGQGDEAVILDPYYPPYDSLVRTTGAVPVHVSSSEENNWSPRIEDIERILSKRTRVILLNTPNNPTGQIYAREFLESIGELATQHDLVVVSDEAYEGLVYDDARHVSPGSIEALRNRSVSCFSFSKTYAMTGWRLGYVHGPTEFIERAAVVHNLVLAHVTSCVQIAGAKALTGHQTAASQIVQELNRRRKTLVENLNRIPGISCKMPKGTFYVFPNFRRLGISSRELSSRLMRAGVGTSPGSFFGDCAEGFLRLSYSSVDETEIARAVDIIQGVVSVILKA